MAVYVITGKLGAGKSLCAVGRLRDYLERGRRVATNLDLRLDRLLPVQSGEPRLSDGLSKWYQPLTVLRVPDKPTRADLDALGVGSDSVEEETFGLLVLDELGSWLNAREWADKGRQALIDWLIHSRKKRWDVIFIIQHQSMLDKQVREALMEYLVICKRMDRVRVPFFGALVKMLSFGALKGTFPKVHLAVVTYSGGTSTAAAPIVSDRWIYRGRDLYAGYDTEQVFSSSYPHGLYSYLPPWHTTGRYMPRRWTWRDVVLVLGRFFGLVDVPDARGCGKPAARLAPLLALPADIRWQAARRLVERGVL